MPTKIIKRCLNKIIIGARQILLRSTFRIKRVLRFHESIHEPSNFSITEEWNSGKEMEGALNVSKIIAALL